MNANYNNTNNNTKETEIKRVRKTLPKVIALKNSRNLIPVGGQKMTQTNPENINNISFNGFVC